MSDNHARPSFRATANIDGRPEFLAFLLFAGLVNGVPLIFGKIPSGSVERVLPIQIVVGWGIAVSLGSAIALIGLTLRRRADGLAVEGFGLSFVAFGGLTYAVCATFVGGFSALTGSLFLGLYSLACLWRIRRILREFDKARKGESL